MRTNGAGQVAYEDVYAFGHKDAMAVSEFVQLTLKPVGANVSDQLSVESRTLELSALHFAPVVSAGMDSLILISARRHMSTALGRQSTSLIIAMYNRVG